MLRLSLSCALGVVLAASAASAQAPRPERPYRGLFASGPADLEQSLQASASFGTGWDNDVVADARGTTGTSGTPRSGAIGSMSGGLSYSVQADAVSVSLGAGMSTRYYPSLDNKFIRASQGSLDVSVPMGGSTALSVGASASYQPYFFDSLFPADIHMPGEDAFVPDLDRAASMETYLSYQGRFGVSHELSRRTSLGASFSYRNAQSATPDGADFVSRSAGANLSHDVGRGLGVRLGYTYSEAQYSEDVYVPHHGINAGLNYSRALSISRRTTLSFGTGSSATSSEGNLDVQVTGNANLTHELGRSWSAWASYNRNVSFHEMWQQPVMSDGVTVGLGGLLTRRLQFSAGARAALGTVGVRSNSPGFDNVSAGSTLSYAVARFMNVGVTYSYYHHRFDAGVALPAGIPGSLDRHGVRGSVSLWAPLMSRVRRPNASR